MDEKISFFSRSLGIFKVLFFKALLIDVVLEFLPSVVALAVSIPLMYIFGSGELTKNISKGVCIVIAMPLVMFLISAKWAMVYSCHDKSSIAYKAIFNRTVSMTIPFTLTIFLMMFYALIVATPGMFLSFSADTVLHQRLGFILMAIPCLLLFYRLGYAPIIATYSKMGVFESVKSSLGFTKGNIQAKKVYAVVIGLLLFHFFILSLVEMLFDEGLILFMLGVLSNAIFGFIGVILMIKFWIENQQIAVCDEPHSLS